MSSKRRQVLVPGTYRNQGRAAGFQAAPAAGIAWGE